MENNNNRTSFDSLKRDYESALAQGKDTSTELTALATAVAYSVVNKCADPQRKTAVNRDTVSDNGQNPAMVALKRGIAADVALLDNTRRAAAAATKVTYTADGDVKTVTADKTAANALDVLIGETLSDGMDLVQTAALSTLEQAAEHADGGKWLDRPYMVHRLSKRVYIQAADSAAYKDVETTPIQETYRTVRRAVQDSRAVQTDPRNGYLYIDELTADGLDTIYRRVGKYADLGGYDCNGNYTADKDTVDRTAAIVERLALTGRQALVLRLRMQRKGYKAIATYLGVTQRAVAKTVAQIQAKARSIGFTPSGYTAAADTADNAE